MYDNQPNGLPPFLSPQEKKKYANTLEDLSRNSMIRLEVMAKRKKGQTVENACRKLAKVIPLSESRIRDIYYGKTN